MSKEMQESNIRKFTAETAEIAEKTESLETSAYSAVSAVNLRRLASLVFCILILGLLPMFSGCDRKDSFPNRPITFICPWGAGGGTDRISRQLAFLLEKELGVPVNVVNATGGGGVTGHSRGARARPDGYTITMVTVELNMLHWRGLTSISHEDFKPVMMVNQDAAAVFVRTDSQWKTLGELEQTVRENPGKLKASGTAFGGIWHVALAGWLTTIGLQASDVTWIAMSGAAPSLQELMADGLDIVACSLPEAQVLLKADKLRCLGVMAEQRLPAYPEISTFKELGVDWQLSTHRGIALPVGVPESRSLVIENAVPLRNTHASSKRQTEHSAAFSRARHFRASSTNTVPCCFLRCSLHCWQSAFSRASPQVRCAAHLKDRKYPEPQCSTCPF